MMFRQPALFLFSACGLLLPAACGSTGAEPASSGSDALTEADPAVAAYENGNAFSTLTPAVQAAVKAALTAAKGAESRHAMLDLFKSANWIMLGAAYDPTSCTQHGADAQSRIALWLESASIASDAPAVVDARVLLNVGTLKAALADVGVQKIDGLLGKLHGYLAKATPPFADPAAACAPASGSTTTSPSNGCADQTTTAACPTHASNQGGEARDVLAALFENAAHAPSAGLLRDWNALRGRYQTGLLVAPLAHRTALRAARHEGSMTLARDASAVRRFDVATGLVDGMVRGRTALTVDAMSTVHAIVADTDRGQLRAAGQEVASGRQRDRNYLPGAVVAAATDELFGEVRARLVDREAAPAVAAMLDQRLISIHPYMNANGRTTRLMTDLVLARDGFPPAVGVEQIATTLLWQQGAVDRDAPLERITRGMERAVALLETGAA